MLTVLQKQPNGDTLYEATSVQTQDGALYVFRADDKPPVEITSGQVFVMNSAGATVAKYDYRAPS